jgi:drug/metabolite transporter (DMT)-like permease
VGLAAALIWACAPLIGISTPRNGKVIAALAVLGLGNNALPFALIAWGQTHLPSGLASILNAATPLFTMLAAHVLTAEEKLNSGKVVGAVAAIARSSARTCC